MNCNCLEDVRARVTEHMTKQLGVAPERVECENAGIVFGETVRTSVFLNFNIKADKPGYRSQKGKPLSVHVSHCPFCGKSAEAEPVTKERKCNSPTA